MKCVPPNKDKFFICSVPLMVLALVGTGIYATIKLGFPQLKYLRHGIDVTRGIYDNPNDEGDLNHFRALTTALSATVGIAGRILISWANLLIIDHLRRIQVWPTHR